MPTDAHEAVLAPLTYACTNTIYGMYHDNAVVQVHVSGNTCFISDHITGDPDMHICMSSTLSDTSSESKLLMTMEVGFTQGKRPVIGKLNYYIIDSQDLESTSSFHLYDEWKPKWTKKNTFSPVIVNIHAWVRTSPTAHIDVHQCNASYAYGSLHPEHHLDDVDRLFGSALKRISQKILSYYEEHMEGACQAHKASSGSVEEDGGWGVVEESGLDVEADHNNIEL
ncbi:hypothetical protein F4604DRAFT_1921030 [Suillus subluteus]|nr:hypothetical protein F4604DRAFT_1921030 [Suillus subluteus]